MTHAVLKRTLYTEEGRLNHQIQNKAYHSGVLFGSSVISDNSQGVHIAFLSVQQAGHCDTALKQHTLSHPIR